MILYGIKGVAAYADHARRLGREVGEVIFIFGWSSPFFPPSSPQKYIKSFAIRLHSWATTPALRLETSYPKR